MKLNEEQTTAVVHPLNQPACLIAGAGSGKTKCLQSRVVWLISEGIPPNKILAVTFTNKAANEIAERVIKALPGINNGPMPRMSTIHALALSGIRKNPKAFGLQEKITPLDEYDQNQLVKKIVEQSGELTEEEDPWKITKKLLKRISYHRARGIGFRKEYTDTVHEHALKIYAGLHAMSNSELKLWVEFEEEKKRQSLVDFDDMLHLAVRRMRTDPQWLAMLHKQFDHVLVDEAQDLSPVQWEFVNGLLHPDNHNLYAVGDVSQSIMGFNGSAPELLIEYSQGWRGLNPNLYRIARNHRSVPEIVDFANLIQQKMTMTIPLTMESWRGLNKESGEVRRLVAAYPQNIAALIAGEIKQGSCNGIAYKDNAILVRTGLQIYDIESELVRRRVPYIIRGGRGILMTEEIRDVLAYLRLIANPKDFTSLVRAASSPRRGTGEAAFEKIRKQANVEFDGDLIRTAHAYPKLTSFCDAIEHAARFKDAPITAFEKLMSMIDYKEYVRQKYKKEPAKVQSKLENIERFGMMIIMLSQNSKFTLDDLIFQLTLERPKGDEIEEREGVLLAYDQKKISVQERDAKLKVLDQGSVTISTIHSAKGLEWKRVYVTNLVEGSLPHMFSLGSEDEIEEERRLFYVACTRARDFLIWCVPEKQLTKDRTKSTRLTPSRFLSEIKA